MKNVLIHIHSPEFPLWSFPDPLGDQWRDRFAPDGLAFTVARDDESFQAALPRAHAVIGGGVNETTFGSAQTLEWIQTATAGVGSMLFPDLVASRVVLTNARGVYSEPMAEHLLAMMLALVRGLPMARDAQHEGRWAQHEIWKRESTLGELSGRSLGVLGPGSVGRALARRASALGVRVIAVRRRADAGAIPGVAECRSESEIDWLLSSSDFVANCLPSTESTRGLISRERIGHMRPDAYFLNVGRGNTVDEDALVEALESGRIAGAGLDVTAVEPLPPESPLYRLPNVLLTPHVSGTSDHFWERAAALFEDNLERYAMGRELRNVVDKEQGY